MAGIDTELVDGMRHFPEIFISMFQFQLGEQFRLGVYSWYHLN